MKEQTTKTKSRFLEYLIKTGTVKPSIRAKHFKVTWDPDLFQNELDAIDRNVLRYL
jgi:hypothetical protein